MIRIAMTRPQFEAAKVEVEDALGVKTVEDSGTGEHSGVKVAYTYDGETLTINVLHKPFFVSEEYVEHQIAAYFAAK